MGHPCINHYSRSNLALLLPGMILLTIVIDTCCKLTFHTLKCKAKIKMIVQLYGYAFVDCMPLFLKLLVWYKSN